MALASAIGASRLVPMLLASGVGLLAFAWLRHVNPPFLITDDGIRDLLLARDCTDLDRCHVIGASASLLGLHHGAVWVDLLVANRLLGGDTESAITAVLALLALGVATCFIVTWQWLRATIAIPVAVLLTAALGLERAPSLLTNASAAPFPDILTAAALLCFALSGQRRFLCCAAFGLGVAVNVHVASLSLVAPFLAVAFLARARPRYDLALALAIFAATCFFTSSAALRANLHALAEQRQALPALAAALVIAALATAAGTRFRRASPEARAWAVGALLIGPFAAASGWVFLWQGLHFNFFYLHPVAAPAAVIAAALICIPFELAGRRWTPLRWIPTAATLAALAVAAAEGRQAPFAAVVHPEPWSLAEAEAIGRAAVELGWSYEDLVFHLQGVACRDLLVRASVTAPPPDRVARAARRQLQVVKVRRDQLADLGWQGDAVQLSSTAVALLRDVPSWLAPESLRACRTALLPGAPPTCVEANPQSAALRAPGRFLFSSRSFPEIHYLDLPRPYVASYEIPLRPAAGESRELAVSDERGWMIARADGVRIEGKLPARRVRLHSADGAPGLVVIEKPFAVAGRAPQDLDMRYPPCLFETKPGDRLLNHIRID